MERSIALAAITRAVIPYFLAVIEVLDFRAAHLALVELS